MDKIQIRKFSEKIFSSSEPAAEILRAPQPTDNCFSNLQALEKLMKSKRIKNILQLRFSGQCAVEFQIVCSRPGRSRSGEFRGRPSFANQISFVENLKPKQIRSLI